MRPNIESSRIYVLLGRVTGSSNMSNISNGKHPTAPHFFVAAAYVSFIECCTTGLCLHLLKPAVVKASWRRGNDIRDLMNTLTWRQRSHLVEHLIGSAGTPAASASDVIYYYCDYADQRTLHLGHVLGSLLKQLLIDQQVPEHIETQLLQVYTGGSRSPSENSLDDILRSVVALRPKLYVVFDGLDECENPIWKAVLKSLERLGAEGRCRVKIFITCVEEGSVSHHLASHACIHLSPQATTEDIRSFITSSVRSRIESGDLKIRNPKLEQDIISGLASRANGM